MNRLRWEQSASVSYTYKYLNLSRTGFVSPSKRKRLKDNLTKSTLWRDRESESRWARWWPKQRRQSGLPREMGSLLLCWQRTQWFFKVKMLFSTSLRVSECTSLVIRGRRLSKFVWHQAMNSSSKGWKNFQYHGAWLYKGEFHQVTRGIFLKKNSLKVEVHHLFSCFGKTQKFATVRLLLV